MKLSIKILSLFLIVTTTAYAADTASILPPAKTTFLDSNGKPLTAGTVDMYIPTTTTRKATWQDAAETILNTNPVVLDAAGRALILGSGSYRQVVKDRNGNIIWDQVTSSTGSGSSPTTATGDGDLVGTIKPWAGMTAPNQYAFTYGQEISRTTYAILFTAITSSQAVFCTSGSPILTGLSDTTNFWIGSVVEINCLAAGNSTIISKTSSTVTLAANANITANSTAIFLPWGRGNGTTTFNLPDFRGLPIVGNNNMGGVPSSNLNTTYFGATDPNSIGALGGFQSSTLATSNLPAQTPSGTIVSTFSAGNTNLPMQGFAQTGSVVSTKVSQGSNNGGAFSLANTVTGTVSSTFTGTTFAGQTASAFSNVGPSKTSNYIIKITPDANSATASGVTEFGGMIGSIACGAGLVCTGNTVSVFGGGVTSLGGFTGILPATPYTFPLSNYSTLSVALAAIGATKATLVLDQAITLSASTTIPSNVKLVILQGGSITKASTFILTINGQLEAPLSQVFIGFTTGDVTLSSTIAARPEWWGALGDNSHDDYSAIQSAIDAYPTGGGTIKFRLARYIVTSGSPTIIKSFMTLECNSQMYRQVGIPTIISSSATAPALKLLGTSAGGSGDGTLENTIINNCYFSRNTMGTAGSITVSVVNTVFTTFNNGGWSLSTIGMYIKNANSINLNANNGSIGGDLTGATMYGIQVDGQVQGSTGVYLNKYTFFGSSSPTATATYAYYDIATAVGASSGDRGINNFIVSGDTTYGIWIQDTGGFGANLQIYNTVMDSIKGNGITLYSAGNSGTGSQQASISGAWINQTNASGTGDGILIVGRGGTSLENLMIANSGSTANFGVSIEGAKYGTMSNITLAGSVVFSAALRLITSTVDSDNWAISNVNVTINSPITLSTSSNTTITGIVAPLSTITLALGSNFNKVLGDFGTVINSGTGNTVYGSYGTSVSATLANNLNAIGGIVSPTPTRPGDIIYWDGASWVTLPGNNSGTLTLQENASGVPSWASVAGTGTVTSATIAAGTGTTVSGTCTITTSGTCVVNSNVASVDNFLPNVQWQLWSGSTFIPKQNAAGTASQAGSFCSSFTTATQGPVFTCSTTSPFKVGDLVVTTTGTLSNPLTFWGFAGAGYITCSQVNCTAGFATAARVLTIVPSTSIQLTSPGFGGISPVTSQAVQLIPISPGDLGTTTNGPDGWTKTSTLITTIDDFGAAATPASTVYPGCIRPLLLRKGITGNESIQWSAPTSQISRYQGRTISFGVVIYQRVQGGANTWQTYINDNTGATSSAAGTGASLGGYQFMPITRTIAATATSISIGIQTEGNAGDVFAVCLPTAGFIPSIVESQLKQNSGEIIRVTSHWNPPLMTPYLINFPSALICGGCGLYGYNGNDLEALSLGTVHKSVGNVYGKLEWSSTTVGAQVFVGGNVNITNGLTFGIQASSQVSGVVFPTSITRMPMYHDGTFAIYTGTSGLVPTNGTFDFTDVDTSPPTSVD